MNGNFFTTEFN